MTTLSDFTQDQDIINQPVHEDPLSRLLRLALQAGLKQVALDLEDEISMVKKGRQVRDPVFRAGQPVWWFPQPWNRPSFMLKTQVVIAAEVRTMNQERGTVLIEHYDATRTRLAFLVQADELVRREIPR